MDKPMTATEIRERAVEWQKRMLTSNESAAIAYRRLLKAIDKGQKEGIGVLLKRVEEIQARKG